MAPLQNGVREAATPEELSCTSYSSIFWKVKIEKKKTFELGQTHTVFQDNKKADIMTIGL